MGDAWPAPLLGVPEPSYPDFLESSMSIWLWLYSAPGHFVSRHTQYLHPSTASPQHCQHCQQLFCKDIFFFFLSMPAGCEYYHNHLSPFNFSKKIQKCPTGLQDQTSSITQSILNSCRCVSSLSAERCVLVASTQDLSTLPLFL